MKVTLEYSSQTVKVHIDEIVDELPRDADDAAIEKYVREYIDSSIEAQPWPSYTVRVDDVVEKIKERLQTKEDDE